MRINHPVIKSNLFKLAGTFELDVVLSPELNFPVRFEVFQDTEKSGWFRVHVWEQEFFRVEPTFPVKRNGKTTRYKCDERLLLERSENLSGNYNYFKAKNAAAAVSQVVKDIKDRLEHWTGVKSK